MPDFTSEIEIEVDEFWDECTAREKEELIDILVEDGWVLRKHPKGSNPDEFLPSIAEIEFKEMVDKLSSIRLQLTIEEEDIIKQILKNY